MAENDPEMHRLNELERRLQQARGGRKPEEKPAPPPASPSQMGIAVRLVTELLAGVIVGGAIGWALDRVFGTSPILLIVCFLIGVAAGILNVQRAARELNENNAGKE
ncbi:MAG TPA: AtpZ/AtpI family protein [Micropepsaceae bacterium]|nr:AtpZ/AtpI family protein [Micropepsaceae bacterium]